MNGLKIWTEAPWCLASACPTATQSLFLDRMKKKRINEKENRRRWEIGAGWSPFIFGNGYIPY